MKKRFNNLGLVINSWPSVISGVLVAAIFWTFVDYLSDRKLIAGNFGATYGFVNTTIDIVSIVLIALFVMSFVYKTIMFKTIRGNTVFGWLGGFLSALVTGCGACSLTLAAYLGLASFLAFLPWGGLEIKILGISLLLRSVRKNINDLLFCKIDLSKK